MPDKELHTIPFSALFDKITNQYLIQKHPVAVAPSATISIKCLIRSKYFTTKATNRLLAIGNPKFSRCNFPTLPNLEGAEQEAKTIASLYLYPNAQLFTNQQATKSIFLANISQSDIVHFAGHAMINNKSPLHSKLVFASDKTLPECDDDNGVLYAYDLYGTHFANTKLVILAACKTATGQTIPGEGVSCLARPFLAAGVPTTIASLWNVNDDYSKRLFEAFHKNYLIGKDAITALQLAQISLITSTNLELQSPLVWGAFVTLGAAVPNTKN